MFVNIDIFRASLNVLTLIYCTWDYVVSGSIHHIVFQNLTEIKAVLCVGHISVSPTHFT